MKNIYIYMKMREIYIESISTKYMINKIIYKKIKFTFFLHHNTILE